MGFTLLVMAGPVPAIHVLLCRKTWMPATSAGMTENLLFLVAALFAQALERHDLLVLGGIEHDHALRRAPGDADAGDRRADQLAAVGDQHDLVGLFHREGADDLAGLLGECHGDDAFAAAAGGAVLVGRRALAEAALRHRQYELLRRR